MGSGGFRVAAGLQFQPDEVILEVGSEREEGSTTWLSQIGPPVVTVDVDPEIHAVAARIPNVEAHLGRAEVFLGTWSRPVRFAWLDGFDWPYDHMPSAYWDDQRDLYRGRGQPYSAEASQRSHYRVAQALAPSVVPGGLVAFDDTWIGLLAGLVPPGGPDPLDLAQWNGKGGTAVPWMLSNGFELMHWRCSPADTLVLLRKVDA